MILGLRVVGGGELGVGSDMEVIDWVGVKICLGPVTRGRGPEEAEFLAKGNSERRSLTPFSPPFSPRNALRVPATSLPALKATGRSTR
jgi:hypothetical protein